MVSLCNLPLIDLILPFISIWLWKKIIWQKYKIVVTEGDESVDFSFPVKILQVTGTVDAK